MNKKGFTLIELLAVIVILAIIALIAVPIILNIINDARDAAKDRSAENYLTAAKQTILKYQMNGTTIVSDGEYTVQADGSMCNGSFCIPVEVDGEKPEATTSKVTLTGGKVTAYTLVIGGKEISKSSETAKTETYYYSFKSGSIGGNLPADATTNLSELNRRGKPAYLRLKSVDKTTVTEAEVCFEKGGSTYCLKGVDKDAYEENKSELDVAFPGGCSDDGNYNCDAGGVSASASSNGIVSANGDDWGCNVNATGSFKCIVVG